MAVVIEHTYTGNTPTASANDCTVSSVTVEAGEILVVGCFMGSTGASAGSPTSVKWNTTEDLTEHDYVFRDAGVDAAVHVWYLTNPTATTASVVVDWAAATRGGMVVYVISGADTTTPLGTANKDSGYGTDPGVSVSSASGDLALDFIAVNDSSTYTLTVDGGQNELVNAGLPDGNSLSPECGASTKAGDTSVSMGWTVSAAGQFAYLGVSLNAASGSAFPQVTSITETSSTDNGPSCVIDLPATVADDELLLLLFHVTGSSEITVDTSPAGWTNIINDDTYYGWTLGLVKVGASGDSGGTATVVMNTTFRGWSAQVYRITGWGGTVSDVEANDTTNGSLTSNFDPPSLTASWGSDNNLWIAGSAHGDDDEGVSVWPTSYTNTTLTNTGGGTDSGGSLATSRRENATATEDPSAMTLTATAVGTEFTIVVKPGSAPGGGSSSITSKTFFIRNLQGA